MFRLLFLVKIIPVEMTVQLPMHSAPWFTAKYFSRPCHTEKKLTVVSMAKLNKVDEKVVATLQAEAKELSLQELTDKTGEPSKKGLQITKKAF
jgi:hypothetical protein